MSPSNDKKTCRVLVIRDYNLMEPDNEIETISLALNLEGIDHEIVGDDVAPDAIDRIKADIVVLDYGGMASMGAWDTAAFNVRYVMNWAEDHPSVALLIWTFFTAQIVATEIYGKEIERAFDDAPANIFNLGSLRITDDEKRIQSWKLIKAMIGAL